MVGVGYTNYEDVVKHMMGGFAVKFPEPGDPSWFGLFKECLNKSIIR
jgi:hypothetical protein